MAGFHQLFLCGALYTLQNLFKFELEFQVENQTQVGIPIIWIQIQIGILSWIVPP